MAGDREFNAILSDVLGLLEAARHASARAVNSILTTTYWEIGRRIVEEEQARRNRAAEYGKELVTRLAVELTARFGRGFSRRSLFKMRVFYLEYCDRSDLPDPQKIVPPVAALSRGEIVSAALTLSPRFPLPWSHYVEFLGLRSKEARVFYEREALRGGWTKRQLQRQIATDFYERTMSSRGRPVRQRRYPGDVVTAEEELKDPYVLEFLGLKDDHSESEVEEGLIRQMQSFLLELGGNFAFIGRQQRMRVGDQWYRVDLLFFHRKLRCLVIIDLKLGALTGADVGQMHLYVNYARENWMMPGENPPVGLILSGKKNAAVAHYAMDGLPDNVLAAEYRTALPAEKLLVDRINRSWKLLEPRGRKGGARRDT